MRGTMTHSAADSPSPAPGSMLLSKHRVEALADGLFAIVMTLLVLEFKVPDLPRHATTAELLHEMAPLGRVGFSFVLTFFLASMFWMSQQTILTATRTLDRVGAMMHLAAMMFVALMPFSTAMLGRYISSRLAMGIYFGNQFVIALLLCLEWFRERRRRNIGEIPGGSEERISLRTASMVGVLLGATIAGSLNPQYAAFGALPALIAARLYRRKMNVGR
jgi:uncharacterized membrane protein